MRKSLKYSQLAYLTSTCVRWVTWRTHVVPSEPVEIKVLRLVLTLVQFPFDLGRASTIDDLRRLKGYDYVFLNSQFSAKYYDKYATDAYLAAQAYGWLTPEPSILYPPVEPYGVCSGQRKNNIVMLGRFFAGRQSKGHDIGITVFRDIVNQLPSDASLTLIGNLMKGHEKWLMHLRTLAEGLPITFMVSATPEAVLQQLCSSKVLWHLTGIDVDEESDPASIEHFGLAVGEGMAAGLIPVVLGKGGITEIVMHGITGMVTSDKGKIGAYTVQLLKAPDATLLEYRKHGMLAGKQFSAAAFNVRFASFVHRGFVTKSFRHLVSESSWLYKRANLVAGVRTDKVAVLVEPRMHWALAFVVSNAVQHLGPEWMVHVFHGQSNRRFARDVLRHIPNVRFTELPMNSMSTDIYNGLMTNISFWNSLGAEHVLTLQTDSVILGHDITPFLEYDFVGAPWHLQNERWGRMQHLLPIGVGNGGFSLRRASAMRYAIQQWGHTTNSTEQEDVFFSRVLQKHGWRVAQREVAYKFCVEVICNDLQDLDVNAHPFALHAFWYYASSRPDLLHSMLNEAIN
jgi:glycosyltransferase involved in cell wall biosynthesis